MADPLLNVSVGLSLTLIITFTLLSVITLWLLAKAWPEDSTVRNYHLHYNSKNFVIKTSGRKRWQIQTISKRTLLMVQ